MNAYNGSDDDDDNMVFIKLKCVYVSLFRFFFCLIEKKIQKFKRKQEKSCQNLSACI